MTQTISAIFDRYTDATAAVSALEANGVSNSDISIIANNTDGTHRDGVGDGVVEKSDAAADAGIGAGIGATLGGAAPIWANFMQFAVPQLTGGSATAFQRPAGIVERVVCSLSGAEPSEWCPDQRTELLPTTSSARP